MNHADDIAALAHCRSILVRVTAELTEADLDWRVLPDSKTIGEILLHVASFEFVMVSAARGKSSVSPDHIMWRDLKAGFAREAGFTPPTGITLEEYFDTLGRVREATLEFFNSEPSSLVKRGRVDIPRLTAALSVCDDDTDPQVYRRLQEGVGTSFVDDGAVVGEDYIHLPELLRLHETYHRGQITFQKYLLKRLNGARFDQDRVS